MVKWVLGYLGLSVFTAAVWGIVMEYLKQREAIMKKTHRCTGIDHFRTGAQDRLVFFATCACGWTSRNRATRAAADQEHREHVTVEKIHKRIP